MTKLILAAVLLMTYGEWFLRTYELQVVYPFTATRVLPQDAGEPRLHEITLPTPDGETLLLWSAPPQAGRPLILYFHGNAGNLASRSWRFSQLLDRGYGLLAPAYRGAGGSTGLPDEVTLMRDAMQIFDNRADFPGGDARIILYGESLGTAVAARIAAVRDVAALVLESPFTSFPDLAAIQYPEFDLSGAITQIWDTRAVIPLVHQPLLVFHGADDRLVPITLGEAIFHAAASRDKQMLRVEGAGHTSLWTIPAQTTLYRFLERH